MKIRNGAKSMLVFIPFDILGIILIVIIFLAISGVDLIVKNLYNIVLSLTVLIGLSFLSGEIAKAISKKRPLYILNALFGCVFFLFGFEILYETIALVMGSVDIMKSIIIYVTICGILSFIIFCSHNLEEKTRYRVLALLHIIVIVVISCAIPFIGINMYYKNELESIQQNNASELTIVNDTKIYFRVDLSSSQKYNSSWYPLEIAASFGTFKQGTKVYFDGDDYGEYYKVTDGEKAGYVLRTDLSN